MSKEEPQGAPAKKNCHSGCVHGTTHSWCRTKCVKPHWSYEEGSDNGPSKWGGLCEAFSAAKDGKQQSPIDIRVSGCKKNVELGKIDYEYHSDNEALILNNGHTIQINWEGGTLKTNGDEFKLVQFHFHSPSEHLVDGKQFPLEMHLVHLNEKKQIAVIGVLFDIKEGNKEHNVFLKQFFHHLPDHKHMSTKGTPFKVMSPEALQLKNGNYYRYKGSLTTPPCSEDVLWTMMEHIAVITQEEVDDFVESIHVKNGKCGGNNRPCHPLNSREIELYQEE